MMEPVQSNRERSASRGRCKPCTSILDWNIPPELYAESLCSKHYRNSPVIENVYDSTQQIGGINESNSKLRPVLQGGAFFFYCQTNYLLQ